jgi:predicted ATPase/DNA-binding SARP family transcriptional activator
MLEVRLLSTFEIKSDGAPIALPSRAAQSLFAYLTLNEGDVHRRERLAGMLWPDTTEGRARTSLRHELWLIRQALAPTTAHDALITDKISVAFAPSEGYWLDVRQLDQLTDEASTSELMDGLAVYRGELLPGFYEDWITLERERLGLAFEKRIYQLLHNLEAEKRWREVLDWAERWLALGRDPEPAFRSLMVAYSALGERGSVQAAYERCTEALAKVGLEPSDETRLLAEARTGAIHLPAPVTSFIGRKRELTKVVDLVLTDRLVTLTGVGGVGKTRLALEAARELANSFPDGISYMELATIQDAALVPSLLLSLLHVSSDRSEQDHVTEALVGHLRSRHALIVLDNCEHLIGACAELVDSLITSCPDLHLLATSREPLRVGGETSYSVPPLETPILVPEIPPSALAKVDSVRLFVERAKARSPSFVLTVDNAPDVAQLCTGLDGIPLAIELAAGRVGSITPQAIVEHLNERFAVMTSGSRTDLPHHRSLRAMIDWSYELLSDAERALLRRLSVFAGGWTLKAGQKIAGFGVLHEGDVLRLLPDLAEKSLVILRGESGRYDMLETIRQYCQDRLREAGEESATHDRHVDYLLGLARSTEPGAGQDEISLADLAGEHDNLLSAISWCSRVPGAAQQGMELIGAAELYWRFLGQYEMTYQAARRLLSLPQARVRNLARRRALYALARLGYFAGHWAELMQPLEECLSIASEISDRQGVADALHMLGNVSSELGKEEQARQYLEHALQIAPEFEDSLQLGCMMNDLGECLRLARKYEEAESLYAQSLQFKRQTRNPHAIMVGLTNLAAVSISCGALDRGRERLLEAFALVPESGGPTAQQQFLLQTCAGFMVASGELARAASLYGASEAQRQRLGEMRSRADEEFIAPLMEKSRAGLGEAEYLRASRQGSQIPFLNALSEAEAELRSMT